MSLPILRVLALATLCASAAACATKPAASSGFLSTYDGLVEREDTVRASVRQRRDDEAAQAIERVRIEPAVLAETAVDDLTPEERAFLLRELDRQVCYELSERFTVVQEADAATGRVRVAATHIGPTGRIGSTVSAAANYFIPGPIGVRAPGTTGGLAAEAELLAPDGATQIAAIVFARNATVVGTDSPSLSRIGDAVQLAEPFGDMVGDAFAPTGRKPRPIVKPDPCAAYGPRFRPEGFIGSAITGLYAPELSGGKAEKPGPTPQ